jgi:hypothetical protein
VRITLITRGIYIGGHLGHRGEHGMFQKDPDITWFKKVKTSTLTALSYFLGIIGGLSMAGGSVVFYVIGGVTLIVSMFFFLTIYIRAIQAERKAENSVPSGLER